MMPSKARLKYGPAPSVRIRSAESLRQLQNERAHKNEERQKAKNPALDDKIDIDVV